MSIYKRQADEKAPKTKKTPAATSNWSKGLLSPAQIKKLATTAREAFEIQTNNGVTTDSFDDWRRAEMEVASGHRSFKTMSNNHFRSVLARFLALAGRTDEAAELWKNTGRVEGSQQIGDTHENREVCRAIIRDLIAASRGAIGDAYVAKICADKFSGATIHTATAAELQQLVFTLRKKVQSKT
jgi:hypothetical protein